jgi:HAD superfamily hydrolase (TIGR01509 family)
MEPLVRNLAGRHRVVIFSNTNAAHIDHIRVAYPAFGHAHKAYLSYELGLVKPDPASYLRVLELEGRAARDCIFIDDRKDNTAAAAALGLKTVTFTGRAAFAAAMAELGAPADL